MKKLFPFLLCIPVSLFLYSCANVAAPMGGKKDEKKPKLTRTTPRNGSTQFRGKTIAFTFSEWVDENKLKEQIIITPKIEEYSHSITKNTLTLTLDSTSLLPNTTYYFNLREGIKDITEGNKADSVTLVFTTGSRLDSLFLSGETLLALENKKEKNLSVALYTLSDTFNVEKSSPLYVTKTDDGGHFTFSYLKEGTYLLYAFKDDNGSGKYEKGKEYIAYLPEPITITESGKSQNLVLIKEDHEKPKIKSVEANKKRITKILYSKPLKELKISNLNVYKMNILYTFKQDEISIFTNDVIKDTARLILEASDFSGNNSYDTVKIVSLFVDTTRASYSSLPNNGAELEPSEKITIGISKPYKKFSPRLEIKTQGTVYKGKEIEKIADLVEVPNQASIQLIPKKTWTDTLYITVYPQSFDIISGYVKDTLKLKYTLKNMERFGAIGGQVETSSDKIIVQLTTKDDKPLKETTKKEFLFEYLNDGEYKVRVIEDLNGNGKWDQGDYRTKKMPEPIHHYTEPIKLKSNWEILDVKITF